MENIDLNYLDHNFIVIPDDNNFMIDAFICSKCNIICFLSKTFNIFYICQYDGYLSELKLTCNEIIIESIID